MRSIGAKYEQKYMQAKAEDIQRAIYEDMNKLQGVQSTYWTGAAWRAQDSSILWRFNDEVVLPLVMEGLWGKKGR